MSRKMLAGNAGKNGNTKITAGRRRRNTSVIPVIDAPITDRYRLLQLRKWVNDLLSSKKTYRWIACRTWRGSGSHGFWERVAKGKHLEKKPRIRAREQDWHDMRILHQTVMEYNTDNGELFNKTLVILTRRAELDAAFADLLSTVRRITGEKR